MTRSAMIDKLKLEIASKKAQISDNEIQLLSTELKLLESADFRLFVDLKKQKTKLNKELQKLDGSLFCVYSREFPYNNLPE